MGFDAIVDLGFARVAVAVVGERVERLVLLPRGGPEMAPSTAVAREAVAQLRAYRADPGHVLDLPLGDPATAFQGRLRAALRSIPVGHVRTYGELADALDSSPRAIGAGCRANPLPLVVPCHRVIGRHGLGGYTGATGVSLKQALLRHEGWSGVGAGAGGAVSVQD